MALALRRHGVDVTTTQEAGLRTRSDTAQLDYIRGEGRVIMTHDTDFLQIAGTTSDHSGIVYCLALGILGFGEKIAKLQLQVVKYTPVFCCTKCALPT